MVDVARARRSTAGPGCCFGDLGSAGLCGAGLGGRVGGAPAVIVKVLPRKGGSTRASARKLMAYLLGPGDLARRRAGSRPASWATGTPSRRWSPAGTRSAPPPGPSSAGPWTGPSRTPPGVPCTPWPRASATRRQPGSGWRTPLSRATPVWHTIMAAHPDDGQLTDDQWQAIAARLMHQTGLHPDGSDNPVRWVAVRHGPNAAGADHIHVMAVLARLDGTRASIHNDVFAAQGRRPLGRAGVRADPRPRAAPHRPTRAKGCAPTGPASRSDMAAATKTGPPYPKPPAMEPTHVGAGAAGRPGPDVDPAGPRPSRRPLGGRPGHLRAST